MFHNSFGVNLMIHNSGQFIWAIIYVVYLVNYCDTEIFGLTNITLKYMKWKSVISLGNVNFVIFLLCHNHQVWDNLKIGDEWDCHSEQLIVLNACQDEQPIITQVIKWGRGLARKCEGTCSWFGKIKSVWIWPWNEKGGLLSCLK